MMYFSLNAILTRGKDFIGVKRFVQKLICHPIPMKPKTKGHNTTKIPHSRPENSSLTGVRMSQAQTQKWGKIYKIHHLSDFDETANQRTYYSP